VRLLLDTHIWLWSAAEPQKLTRRVAKELEKPENELWLSPISLWEILLLAAKGRIVLQDGARNWIRKTMQAVPVREAPITHEVALALNAMHFTHGDPADHFLAATARVFDLTLVTADRHLMGLKQISVLPNR
jgi:PIN domain nuclease of toxin-antitoxin system